MERKVLHLGKLADTQAKNRGSQEAIRYRDDATGTWQPVTWTQFADNVNQLACAMLANGVKHQENMGIFSQNMARGIYTDFAAFSIGAVTIPLYATSSETQVQYIVNDARIRYLFVGEQQQYDTAFRAHSLCPTLHKLIIYDSKVVRNPQDKTSVYYADFLKVDEKTIGKYQELLKERKANLNDDDIANILYTSGTTGESKGVILKHSNYIGQFEAHFKVLKFLTWPNMTSMDFLPLTHVFERGWSFLCLCAGVVVCVNTDPHAILQSIQEVHPNAMCAVPRFWEKVYDGVNAKIAGMSSVMQKVVKSALKVGREYNIEYVLKRKTAPISLSLKYRFYDKLVFQKLKRAIGMDNALFLPTAGAPIPPTIEEFIHSVGIGLVAGYGLTESLATVSCDHGVKTLGSVGRPLPGIEVKIGENDEILIKGPGVTCGYYKKESATREAFDKDGYFHTGDAGYLKDGELFITDRIKDLFKTSNGKYISPQVLEGRLCVDKYIEQLAVIAEQRKFVSAFIIPAYDELKAYAAEHKIEYKDMKDLCQNKEINQMIKTRIDTLQQTFAAYEQIKRFTLLPEPFTIDKGELTNTLKIRRQVLLKNYSEEIDKMYEA